MTPLRQRMMQDLQLRGYSDRTVEAYVYAVAQLAKFYHASPDQLIPGPPEHRPEGCARDAHHCAPRHQVLLSAHARATVDRPRRRAPQGRQETPRRLKPRRGVADPRRDAHRRLPRLPHHHAVARSNQELVYAALLREAAATVQTLSEDRSWVGGTPGMLAVLHTWTRT